MAHPLPRGKVASPSIHLTPNCKQTGVGAESLRQNRAATLFTRSRVSITGGLASNLQPHADQASGDDGCQKLRDDLRFRCSRMQGPRLFSQFSTPQTPGQFWVLRDTYTSPPLPKTQCHPHIREKSRGTRKILTNGRSVRSVLLFSHLLTAIPDRRIQAH